MEEISREVFPLISIYKKEDFSFSEFRRKNTDSLQYSRKLQNRGRNSQETRRTKVKDNDLSGRYELGEAKIPLTIEKSEKGNNK